MGLMFPTASSRLEASPYHAWNLYRNPFGELTRTERAELAVVEDLQPWLEFLRRPRAALQFVGDCGRGKSTHLLALQKAIADSIYVYFPEDGPRPRLPARRPALIDEAQRMGVWNKWRLLRSSGPIALGTHVDLSSQLGRAGFEIVTVDMQRPLSRQSISSSPKRCSIDSVPTFGPLSHFCMSNCSQAYQGTHLGHL